MLYYTPCLKKKHCVGLISLLLKRLWEFSTNFDNFRQKDGKKTNIMRGAMQSFSPNIIRVIFVPNVSKIGGNSM